MRFFRNQQTTPRNPLDFSTGNFGTEVVGEASYQDALRELGAEALARGQRVEVPMYLVADPTNRHDKKAVKIVGSHGKTVGYLPRDVAAEYQSDVLRLTRGTGRKICCRGVLVGGSSAKPSIGVWLDIDLDDLANRKA
jgi:hypothetical protein